MRGRGSLGGSSSGLVTSYNAITDTNVYVEPTVPTWDAAGTSLTDSIFGTTLYRVTDENTASVWKAGHSWYPNTGSAEECRWAANDAGFLVASDGGVDMAYEFDPVTLTATLFEWGGSSAPYLPGTSPQWDAFNSRLLYGTNASALNSYALDTLAITPVVDYTSLGAGGPADTCVSATNLMTCRLGGQDAAIYAAAYAIGGGTDLVLNTNTGALTTHTGASAGTATMYAAGAAVSWIPFTMHNVRTGRDGRYVMLTPDGATVGSYTNCMVVWDLIAGTVSVMTVNASGHGVSGYGYYVNNGYVQYDYQEWIRSLTSQSGIANPVQLFEVTKNDPTGDAYLSWCNAQSGVQMPVLWTTIDDGETGAPPPVSVPWQREICAIQTNGINGSQTVWRFCHHFSYFDQFYDGVHATMSRTGKYALFGSSWGFTLGTPDPSQGNASGTYRDDVFIADLMTAVG